MEDNENTCIYCNKIFKTKGNLNVHIRTNKKCIRLRDDQSEKNILNCICQYQSFNKHDFKRHVSMCKDSIIFEKDREISSLKERLKNLEEASFILLKTENEQYKQQIEYLKNMVEQAISKPSTSTVNNNQTIKNNNNIMNILSDKYEELTSHERVEKIARESIEKYFWEGQVGIANFCVEHIVKSEDGKMLICCTDPSRKRFKYLKQDQLVEDIDARFFTDKISLPIKNVCREVYDNIIRGIDEEREEKTDAFELNLLDHKTNRAQEKLLEITNIDDHKKNADYKSELSILLKSS